MDNDIDPDELAEWQVVFCIVVNAATAEDAEEEARLYLVENEPCFEVTPLSGVDPHVDRRFS